MYTFLSILLISHSTGFSQSKSIDLLHSFGCSIPTLNRVSFIIPNVMRYSTTGRGDDGQITWSSQRDRTLLLSEFETKALSMPRKMFLVLQYLFGTLDDDFYGTRAKENKMKTHSRFRRRGKSKADNVDKLLSVVLDDRGEQSFHGSILTADRGYGKSDLLKKILEYVVGSIFMTTEHLIRCHRFVAKSHFDFGHNNDDGSDVGEGDTEQAGDSTGEHCVSNAADRPPSAATEQVTVPTTGTESTADENAPWPTSQPFPADRPVQFIIEDDADDWPICSFFHQKSYIARAERSAK